MKIQFQPFQESDLPLFRKWLSEPHAKPFWQETEDDLQLRDKFLNRYPEMGMCPYIIYLEQTPIGYIQSYEACRVGSGWWPKARRGIFGVDLFIGDANFYSKGWGPKILRQFIHDLISNNNVEGIIINPEPKNLKAIAAYKKLGFKKGDVIETPNGKAQLLSLDPKEFINSLNKA